MSIIIIPNTVIRIDGQAIYGCYHLEFLLIPDSVENIGASGISYCYGLENINIPSKVRILSNGIFKYNRLLTSIIIPENINSMESYAFEECISIKDMYLYPSSPPSIQPNTFYNISVDCIYHVRPKSLEAYKTATNWTTITNQIVGDLEV